MALDEAQLWDFSWMSATKGNHVLQDDTKVNARYDSSIFKLFVLIAVRSVLELEAQIEGQI